MKKNYLGTISCLFFSGKNFLSRKSFFLLFLLLKAISCNAQFHGPVGSLSTHAMHRDSSKFINWAKTCIVTRGPQDISNLSFGYASTGHDTNAIGKAGSRPVVSLGDGGNAILSFWPPIKNGPGPDFAVFENAFTDDFLELAFVEVSSDGINFYRFPATSNTQYTLQIGPFDQMSEAEKINNLAGKYRANYGTPFDLEELSSTPGLNVNAISHVKIIDVVGCIQTPYASYDHLNKPINDPWPTAFASGGFDLDAVGVINQQETGFFSTYTNNYSVQCFPIPADNYIKISSSMEWSTLKIVDETGRVVAHYEQQEKNKLLDVSDIKSGIYFITLSTKESTFVKKIIIQHL